MTDSAVSPYYFFGNANAMISSLVTSDPVRLPPVATNVTNCRPSAPMYVIGAVSIDDGSLISHSLSPVAVANARNLKSSVPPTNVSPLAVRITPPVLGRPVFWRFAGSMSETPSVLRYLMSPVSILTATSSPHGVGPHGRRRSGSPKRRRPASSPELIQLPSGRWTSRIGWKRFVVFDTNRRRFGSYAGPQ